MLVLNFASAVHPGGGVRRGMHAQEEDLCRKSSLLVSLESTAAGAYYQYNRELHTYMGSDAMILSPTVEIIKGENGKPLPEPVTVAVLTCAAPNISDGLEGMTEEQYRELFYRRIESVLLCASSFGYRYFVLGAWGCGAFDNDASVVSELFYKAFEAVGDLFDRVDFAVLCRWNDTNYRCFAERFRDMDPEGPVVSRDDAVRGCLIGGAAGDALGNPVEFMSYSGIISEYGRGGIRKYTLDPSTQLALITDDSQMSLFTANAIILGGTESLPAGDDDGHDPYMERCYIEWYMTQSMSFEECRGRKSK